MGSSGSVASAPFDYCVITASTPEQAELYRTLIRRRKECGIYPEKLEFRVYADPPGGRVGSGGGTLVALTKLLAQEVGDRASVARGCGEDVVRSFFGNKRILVLHAGGESRRLPCYVPEGKLFGPLSMVSEVACPPVVLDLLLALYCKYPWVPGEVVLASGDVIVDFDTSRLSGKDSFKRGAICGFGKAAPLEQGSRHGVFAFESGGADDEQAVTFQVSKFLQKASVDTLRSECLIPGTTDQCALDTGIFSLSLDWVCAFFRFATQTVDDDGVIVMQAVEEAKLYFDFYDEVVRASLPGQSIYEYLKAMGKSKLPARALEALHTCMSGLELRGASIPDVRFLHFGTVQEFPEASLEASELSLLPFYAKESAVASSSIEGGVVLVNCRKRSVRVARAAKDDNILYVDIDGYPIRKEVAQSNVMPAWVEMCSDIDVVLSSEGFHLIAGLQGAKLQEELPPGVCLDARHIPSLAPEGQIVAVYSASDTFKRAAAPGDVVFCGVSMPVWLKARGLAAVDLWGEADASSATELWTAKLFRQFTGSEDIEGYWNAAKFSKAAFLEAPRFSLQDLNKHDSAAARDLLRSTLGRS